MALLVFSRPLLIDYHHKSVPTLIFIVPSHVPVGPINIMCAKSPGCRPLSIFTYCQIPSLSLYVRLRSDVAVICRISQQRNLKTSWPEDRSPDACLAGRLMAKA